ncbi:hypothetical protein Pan216_03200 [Planctomycetes bacterium Pan216]|uniref:HlyD family secretion protein n=1 Tax=Kolteria novifilia TaxID=2527975 RepID=A0A518AXN9_9BACT|nr:hypothetical protein Pan216_03200 [Planctomycetes bacterium Pan216]
MPEQEQVNQNLIEQTRREIGKLVAEIEALANQNIPEGEFYAEYLRRISAALAARAAGLWLKTSQGNLRLAHQINVAVVGLDSSPEARAQHDELLRHTLKSAKPQIVAPQSGPGEGDSETPLYNPTDSLLVIAPILVDGEAVGLVEVFQDASRRSTAQQGYLRFLVRIAEEAAKFFKNRWLRQFQSQQELWNQVSTFSNSVHGGLEPKQVAYLVANDGKKLIGCERVSVAIRKHNKTNIEAISGQDIVEKRSNLVNRMSRLADRVLVHGENIVFTGQFEEHWPADITLALEKYLEESPSKLIIVIPMKDDREFGLKSVADVALIVEMVEDLATPDELAAKIEVVTRHGSPALFNALEYRRIPLLPVWRSIGNATQYWRGRRLSKAMMVLIGIAIVTVAMFVIPWPLRLEGRGELVPDVKRKVYAPFDGVIEDVKVEHNDPVEDGSTVLMLHNPDLESELRRLEGELRAGEFQLRGLEAQFQQNKLDKELGGKINQQKQQNQGLREQIELQRNQLEKLRITSPITGKVMDWNPKEDLLRRPIRQGDVLLEIADVDGPWVLDVEYPEDTVAHIARALKKSEDGTLPVTFVLSASPDRTYHGKLIEMATQAKPDQEENVVSAKIELDPDEDLEEVARKSMVSGVEVRAKVNVGLRPVGYVLFRELIDFVREYVFF